MKGQIATFWDAQQGMCSLIASTEAIHNMKSSGVKMDISSPFKFSGKFSGVLHEFAGTLTVNGENVKCGRIPDDLFHNIQIHIPGSDQWTWIISDECKAQLIHLCPALLILAHNVRKSGNETWSWKASIEIPEWGWRMEKPADWPDEIRFAN